MEQARTWHGVRMRTTRAGADAEAVPRQVTLPAAWDDDAAAALAALTPGSGPVHLAEAAAAWINPLARAATQFRGPDTPPPADAALGARRSAERGEDDSLGNPGRSDPGRSDKPPSQLQPGPPQRDPPQWGTPRAGERQQGDALPGALRADPAAALHRLLLQRRGAAAAPLWRGRSMEAPAFVLNLAAFHDPATGFDTAGFAAAVDLATTAMALAAPRARRLAIAIADLASLLAALGLDYDSEAARDVARCVAGLLRGTADAASARFARQSMLTGADWPATPAGCAVPGLAAAAREARAAAVFAPCHRATTAILPPGPAEALLGVAVGGIAPAFSPLAADGSLTAASRAWLAARGVSVEAALAASLAGQSVLAPAGTAAHAAMHEAVAAYVHAMPAHPTAAALPAAPARFRRELPARHGGYTQKIALGGHRLYLRTGEYPDGTLGEVALTLPKDSATARGLMDCLSQAISLGLQHGIGLEAYIELFAGTRFGAAGAVEGDPLVARASSPLDYAIRHLAANYLRRDDIPAPPEAGEAAAPPAEPQLPLALPDAPPRPRAPARPATRPVLRIVGG